MLDAYVRKGARLPTEAADGRRVIEDVITSTLFGPLKFMSPCHAGEIISWFAQTPHDDEVEVTKVDFWPRFDADEQSANEHTIEPDLVIYGSVGGKTFRWVIEVKWDTVLQRYQVDDQVRLCTNGAGNWVHLSLVKSAELAAFECRSTIIQWNEALSTLREVLRSNKAETASLLWCKDAVAFLEKLGVGTFRGFGQLDLAPVTTELFSLSSSHAMTGTAARPMAHASPRSIGADNV